MPGHEEHCIHSERRYGVRGDDIHSWIDEPVAVAGASHRDYRHNFRSLPTAIQIFGPKYGADMVENIFLDHLKADSEETRKKEAERIHTEEETAIYTFPISPFNSAIDGLGRYLDLIVSSAPKSPRELVNSVKRNIQYHSYHEIDYSVNQSFKTSIGEIHREYVYRKKLLLNFHRPEVTNFLGFGTEILFEKPHEDSDGKTVSHLVSRPREEALRRIKEVHSKQVNYRGRTNRRVYTKYCEISERNITIHSLHSVYLPMTRLDFNLLQTPYTLEVVQKSSGEIMQEKGGPTWIKCVCNTCGKSFLEGTGSVERSEGFRCSKCGQTTCRKDGHWRKKHLLFKEFVCPNCYEERKKSGISYSEFSSLDSLTK